jgi:transcriptional regulator with XRE-family HTH domain
MVRRRQLSAILRQYREESGLTAKEVADRILSNPSKITRLEKGQRAATLRDIRDLCQIYGVPDHACDELMELARGSRKRGWWQDAGLDPALQTLIGMEGAAKTISEFEVIAIPGLLQTQDYAEAIITRWIPDDTSRRKSAVDARMRRQQIFQGDSPPAMKVVLDEAAIRRVVGGRDVMRGQLNHLCDLITKSAVDLKVIPFSAGAHLGVSNGFTVLEFQKATSISAEPAIPGVVYLEQSNGNSYLDDPADVQQHLAAFGRLTTQALTVTKSLDLLRAAVREI